MRPGIKTTEFWVTSIVNIVAAVIGILGVRGIVSAEEGDLYVALASALAAAVAPLVMAIVTASYTNGRSRVKAVNGRAGR